MTMTGVFTILLLIRVFGAVEVRTADRARDSIHSQILE